MTRRRRFDIKAYVQTQQFQRNQQISEVATRAQKKIDVLDAKHTQERFRP